jgi:hypothetical protein
VVVEDFEVDEVETEEDVVEALGGEAVALEVAEVVVEVTHTG